MRTIGRFVFVLMCLGIVSLQIGCATGPSYCRDRLRDAGDILTFAVGDGWGAKARVGPVNASLFHSEGDLFGLRNGDVFCVTNLPHPPTDFSYEVLYFGVEKNHHGQARGKETGAATLIGLYWPCSNGQRIPIETLTEIEVAFGVWRTVRFGFNPGELLDFLLGWFGIDIYNDDMSKKEEAKLRVVNPSSASNPP